jgi:1,2-diacylglycerol 3-alpha-glucosyltransferase
LILKAYNPSNFPATQAGNGLPKEPRVAVLFQRFGPYHHARLNAAGKLMRVFGVEACGMDNTYTWDKLEGAAAFTRITLTERQADNWRWKRELDREMRRVLEKIKPDVVVVPGWSSTHALSALAWCGETGTPAIMMSESTAWDEKRSAWKEWVKRRLVNLCSAGLVGGRAHADYLEELGMERGKIFPGYDVVDNDYFAAGAEEVRSQESVVRSRHGLPENYFLASARFVEKKNLRGLLNAYARYREMAEKAESRENKTSDTSPRPSTRGGEGVVPWDLVLLGDGPLRETLNSQLTALNLRSHVHLPGFKQYEELPVYYGLAKAFIHTSTIEQWGLVINEAMASGLPVLVSNRCGCAADLVEEGRNGFSFDPCDMEALAQLMLKISADNFPLSELGPASCKIISQWGTERFADGLARAVKMSSENARSITGLFDRFLLRILACK